jgi:hypothetical protein
LDLILPSPRPQAPPGVFPHSQLRKALRLLIDIEEVPSGTGGNDQNQNEPDISYVYSGWAPLSVRLVQCITQKGGVFANPNVQIGKQRQRSTSRSTGEQEPRSQDGMKAPAHPITGWKGFEDVIDLVPGDTFDLPISSSTKERRTLTGKLPQNRGTDCLCEVVCF